MDADRVNAIGEQAARRVGEIVGEYGGCAESVFAALADTFGLADETEAVFRAAQGMSGGIGEGDAACGAYAGGALMISYLTSRSRRDYERDAGMIRLELLQRLHERFLQDHGGVVCHDLHRTMFGRVYRLTDPEEYAEFEQVAAACVGVMAGGARHAAEIIAAAGVAQR